jgi:hypothetical protein
MFKKTKNGGEQIMENYWITTTTWGNIPFDYIYKEK